MKPIVPLCVAFALPVPAWAQLATQRTGYPVTLTSKPAGAQVWLGKRELGTTPWTGYLRSGSVTVQLRRKGYASRKKTLVVRRIREPQHYHAELQATGGVLSLRGPDTLTGAQVTVNDEPAGTVSADGFREPLAPGRYLVRVAKPGYQPMAWWATLRDGQETSRHVALAPERRGIPVQVPAHCRATLRAAHDDEADPGPALTHLDPEALERAAADQRALTLTCASEPQAPDPEPVPHELIVEAIGGQVTLDGRVRSLPLRTTLPEGTTTVRFTVPTVEPAYKPPTRLGAGDYAVALEAGFPRMLFLGLRVGTGPVFGRPSALEAGTYLQANRLAAVGAAHWHPWRSGPWSAALTLGLEAGSGVLGDHRPRFADLHTRAELAATFPRVLIALMVELEVWTDLHCPRADACPALPRASGVQDAGVDTNHLDRWQWHARPLVSFTVHNVLDGPWALASSLHIAFHPRPTYMGAFGPLLPDSDPLLYFQTGLRRSF